MAKVGEAPESMRGAQKVEADGVAEAPNVEERVSAGRRVWDFLRGPYPTLLSRFVLSGIFLLSGFTKLGAPRTFEISIESYGIPLPVPVVETMARVLPILEIGLGIWLLVGLFTRFSAIIAAIFMSVFTVAITQAWIRGIDADCGCFGGGGAGGNTTFAQGVMKALGPVGDFLANEKIGPIPVLRDLLFLLMALHLIFVPTIFAVDDLRKRYSRPAMES
ncbi:MAG TPA: DoxX family protein [Chloroflexia bacterium]|nr:DoxX family protein [Chloroflexia bacterium]